MKKGKCFVVSFCSGIVQAEANEPSYSAYFSTEKVVTSHNEMDNFYVFLCGSDAVLTAEERQGLTDGYIYGQNLNTMQIVPIVQQDVTSFSEEQGIIYYTVGNKLFSVSLNGQNQSLILEETEPIGHLKVTADLFFYTKGDALYRCHRATGNIDFMGNVSGLVDYEPITNYRLAWWKISDIQPSQEDLLPEERGPVYSAYIIDTQENTVETVEMNSWYNLEPLGEKFAVFLGEAASTMSINGVVLPLPEYRSGSYFTTTGTACDHRNNIYRCKTYSGASQCAGFARYVYAQLFGGPDNGSFTYISKNFNGDGDAAKKFIQGLKKGCRIRVFNNQHSIILANYDSQYVYVYDANRNNNDCRVSYGMMSYSTFANTFINVSNYFS